MPLRFHHPGKPSSLPYIMYGNTKRGSYPPASVPAHTKKKGARRPPLISETKAQKISLSASVRLRGLLENACDGWLKFELEAKNTPSWSLLVAPFGATSLR